MYKHNAGYFIRDFQPLIPSNKQTKKQHTNALENHEQLKFETVKEHFRIECFPALFKIATNSFGYIGL